MGLYQALRSTESSLTPASNYNWLRDPNRGILLPQEYGFQDGFDCAGRPQRVNLQTIAAFYRKPENILAVDRLALTETSRVMPLFPHQRIIFKEAALRQFLFLQMMRGGAKSTSLARFSIDYALQNANIPIIFTGPSFKQSLLMFDECVKIFEREEKNENAPLRLQAELVGDPKRNSIDALIRFYNGSSIRALPMGDGTKIRGYRGGLLIIDEAYQITEEMYTSHLAPFVSVKQGDRAGKIILATTSWFQDCFMYRRLLQIASEVKAGNPDYGILDFNLKDLVETAFPLNEAMWKDAQKHGDKQRFAMTYFNIWPRSTARWYSQVSIDDALSERHGVKVEKEREETGTYVAVFDLAASEVGDSTFVIVWKYENDQFKAVWAHEERGLDPNQRALLAHDVEDRFNPMFIVYDAHGAIGQDFRSVLSQKEISVKGVAHTVTPIVHHDAFNLSGRHKLIPVAVNDTAVRRALIGPRDGTSIRGEAGLKNLLHTKLRDLLNDGKFVGPAYGREDIEGKVYVGSEYEAVDAIRTAYNQLSSIGLAKDKEGNQVYTQDGQLVFETRPGLHDDGAYCIVYATIGYFAVRNRILSPDQRSTPIAQPMKIDGVDVSLIDTPADKIQKIIIA